MSETPLNDRPRQHAITSPSAASAVSSGFGALVDNLSAPVPNMPLQVLKGPRREPLPSRDMIIQIVTELRSVLFPGYFGNAELSADSTRFHIGSTLDRVQRLLHEQVRRGLCFNCAQDDAGSCASCEDQARQITRDFLHRLPMVKAVLTKDVAATFDGDPAANSADEAVFCYPGLLAITNFRLAHELHTLGVPLIPRMITEHAHSITGIDIHPGATIGDRFFIDHGTGVVIGETAIIGENVKIYQGVTLGAKRIPVDEHGKPVKGVARHPIVEDDVVIYSGATILGRVTIGRGAVIGGNVWLTTDVRPGSHVTQAQFQYDRYEQGAGI
ncbi:MAG: serine O-acetyltransferase EpsC [bacterium]